MTLAVGLRLAVDKKLELERKVYPNVIYKVYINAYFALNLLALMPILP